MSGILSKITRYLKKKIQPIIRRKKNQSVETDSEITQMIELVDKNIKTIIVTIFHTFKKLQERLRMVSGDIKKTQILEIKTKKPEREDELDPKFSWELPSWYLDLPCPASINRCIQGWVPDPGQVISLFLEFFKQRLKQSVPL